MRLRTLGALRRVRPRGVARPNTVCLHLPPAIGQVNRAWRRLYQKLPKMDGPACCPVCCFHASGMHGVAWSRIGMALRMDCPRPDLGNHRQVFNCNAMTDTPIAAWTLDNVRSAWAGGRLQDAPRFPIRAIGACYNAKLREERCRCGATRFTLLTVGAVQAGQEILLCHEALSHNRDCQLILCADGGGKQLGDGTCAFGGGIVAYVYRFGQAIEVLGVPLPLPAACSAQEAEVVANVLTARYRADALKAAYGLGFTPLAPELFCGDSKNTIGAPRGDSRPTTASLTVARRRAGLSGAP